MQIPPQFAPTAKGPPQQGIEPDQTTDQTQAGFCFLNIFNNLTLSEISKVTTLVQLAEEGPAKPPSDSDGQDAPEEIVGSPLAQDGMAIGKVLSFRPETAPPDPTAPLEKMAGANIGPERPTAAERQTIATPALEMADVASKDIEPPATLLDPENLRPEAIIMARTSQSPAAKSNGTGILALPSNPNPASDGFSVVASNRLPQETPSNNKLPDSGSQTTGRTNPASHKSEQTLTQKPQPGITTTKLEIPVQMETFPPAATPVAAPLLPTRAPHPHKITGILGQLAAEIGAPSASDGVTEPNEKSAPGEIIQFGRKDQHYTRQDQPATPKPAHTGPHFPAMPAQIEPQDFQIKVIRHPDLMAPVSPAPMGEAPPNMQPLHARAPAPISGLTGISPQICQAVLTQIKDARRERVELALRPDELGGLRFEISGKGEALHIRLFIEKSETMDLIRRHSEQLITDLRQSGLEGASLSFGSWHQKNQPAQRSAGNRLFLHDGASAEALPSQTITAIRPFTNDGHLDLRL